MADPITGTLQKLGLYAEAPDAPGYVPLDPRTQQLLGEMKDRSNQSVDQMTNEAHQRIDQGRSMGQSDQQVAQQAASTGQDPAMLNAIRNQYQQQAEGYLGTEKAKASLDAQMYKHELLKRQSIMAMAEQGARINQQKFLANAFAQQEQARAQFVSSMFQTASFAMIMKGKGKAKEPTSDSGLQRNTGGYLSGPQEPNYGSYLGNGYGDLSSAGASASGSPYSLGSDNLTQEYGY